MQSDAPEAVTAVLAGNGQTLRLRSVSPLATDHITLPAGQTRQPFNVYHPPEFHPRKVRTCSTAIPADSLSTARHIGTVEGSSELPNLPSFNTSIALVPIQADLDNGWLRSAAVPSLCCLVCEYGSVQCFNPPSVASIPSGPMGGVFGQPLGRYRLRRRCRRRQLLRCPDGLAGSIP